MADLIDMIAGNEPTGETLSIHHFFSNMRLYALGEVDRPTAIEDFSLDADAITQAGAMADAIDAETGLSKVVLVLRFEAVMMGVEAGASRYFTSPGVPNKTAIRAEAGF